MIAYVRAMGLIQTVPRAAQTVVPVEQEDKIYADFEGPTPFWDFIWGTGPPKMIYQWF